MPRRPAFDADAHFMEPGDFWAKTIDPEFLERAPVGDADRHGLTVDGRLRFPTLRWARIGQLKPDNEDFWDYRNGPGGVFEYSPFCAVYNASGQPAVSLPLHWTADNLPVGVQLGMPFGADEALMSLSAQIDQAAPWHGKQQELIEALSPAS